MMASASEADLVTRLRDRSPLVAVELRLPRAELGRAASIDAWIDLHHNVGRIGRNGHVTFLTDNAVGAAEEESLTHLAANLPHDVDPAQVVPFLTAKHSLSYCLTFAERALSQGFRALAVVGGDRHVGPPRCVEHGWELRERIRERLPELVLGGWANPHRDPEEQVGFLTDPRAHVDFVLTQIVGHHSTDRVQDFLDEAARQRLDVPVVFGVFHYQSANPETLDRLGRFFPVPREAIEEEIREAEDPLDVTARSIRGLREAGARHVYVSNLGYRDAARSFRKLLPRV